MNVIHRENHHITGQNKSMICVHDDFRWTLWCQSHCSAGGCTGLCSAGRSDVVSVQEELCTFSWAPYAWQCLLQTNELAVYRVRWKRADHRPGGSFRGLALGDSLFFLSFPPVLCLSLTISPSSINATWHCNAVMLTPQDSGEMTTYFFFFKFQNVFEGSHFLFTVHSLE